MCAKRRELAFIVCMIRIRTGVEVDEYLCPILRRGLYRLPLPCILDPPRIGGGEGGGNGVRVIVPILIAGRHRILEQRGFRLGNVILSRRQPLASSPNEETKGIADQRNLPRGV